MPGLLGNIKTIINGFFDSKLVDQENMVETEPIVGNIQDHLFKDEIIAFVKEEFEKRREERAPYELRWRLVQNFLQGNQYCDINEISNTIYQQEKLYFWQQREVYNHIATIVETRLSKLGRQRPAMTVRPMTSENDDIASAKVCKSIIDSTYNSQRMISKIGVANGWSEICGSVFYKTLWDTTGGEITGYIKSCDCEGPCDCPTEPIYEGDVKTVVIPAYEIYPDSCLNDGIEKCRSIIHAKAFTVDEIKEIWNVEVAGTEVDVYSLGSTRVGLGGLGYNATVPIASQTIKYDSQIVMEYYEMPSRTYSKGRLIIIAGDELLYYGTCPYQIGEHHKIALPFARQECIRNSGTFFGLSVAERCLPIQRAYNAIKNRKHEYLNRLTIGIMTYEDGTLMDEEGLEEDGLAPGTLLPRKPGSSPPTFVNNEQIPQGLIEEENRLLEEFKEISGVYDFFASGGAAGRMKSGVYMEILKEEDDTKLSLTADNIRQAIIEVAKHWLRLYKQYSIGPRMTRLVGKDNTVYLNYWNQSQLTSDDVVPLTDDDLSQTPAQKKQQVMTMLQMGLFNNPDTGKMDRSTRAQVMEMLNYGNWEDGSDIDQAHIAKAMRENIDVQNGYELRVRDFDNHTIHIDEHNKFRLTSEYDDLCNERPDLANYFDNHVLVHQQAIQMAQQQQLQAQVQQQRALHPNEQMNFKDLPVAGQIQMAQQAGIQINPQQQQQVDRQQQQGMQNAHQRLQQYKQANKAKITNTNTTGPRDPINFQRG